MLSQKPRAWSLNRSLLSQGGRLSRWLGLGLIGMLLTACTPVRQSVQIPGPYYQGPRFTPSQFVTFDGAALGLSTWQAETREPRAVIVALHGMNDYARAFETAAPFWAAHGITTYAYDARGFGRSPQRGVWGNEALMIKDLRTALQVARTAHPSRPIVVVGESMGAATILAAAGEAEGIAADRLVLIAPAVWGWSNLPLVYRVSLWTTAHLPVSRKPFDPPRTVTRTIMASDNIEMLRRLGRDPNMIFATRLDAVYGLVRLMERAYKAADKLPQQTLVLYGARDQIIPRPALTATVAKLPPSVRTIEYPEGYHMLTRDLQAERVWSDIAAFIADPGGPLPSNLGPIGRLVK
jgi:acylglycerol lipase